MSGRIWMMVAVLFAATGCHAASDSRAVSYPPGYPVTNLLRALDDVLRGSLGYDVAVVEAHGTAPPTRLLCEAKGCRETGQCNPSNGLGVLWFPAQIELVLAGSIADSGSLILASISTGGLPRTDDGPQLWSNIEEWWARNGVYILGKYDDPFTGTTVLACSEGAVEVPDPYTYSIVSWLDQGGPGWFRRADVEKLLSFLKDHPLPESCEEQLQLWQTVTGSPLPEGTKCI